MGLSRTVSDSDGDFSRKSQHFPTPLYFVSPLNGLPLELGIDAEAQKLEWWDYWVEIEVWRYLQRSGYNTPTWRTDRRTDTGRQQRLRIRTRLLCIVIGLTSNLHCTQCIVVGHVCVLDRNVAVVSHGQYVPTLNAAAAWRVSKASWWP